jgi:hypothetical protein
MLRSQALGRHGHSPSVRAGVRCFGVEANSHTARHRQKGTAFTVWVSLSLVATQVQTGRGKNNPSLLLLPSLAPTTQFPRVSGQWRIHWRKGTIERRVTMAPFSLVYRNLCLPVQALIILVNIHPSQAILWRVPP